jgi:outer membrane receptor protein involved in Fe transport
LNNPNLKPSLSTSYEAGLDVRFLQNRIGFNLTWYTQTNKDAVIPVAVSGTSGYSNAFINAGSIRNQGIELSITATPVKTKKLVWTSTLNYAHNTGKILSLYPGLTSLQLDYNRYSSQDMFLNADVGKAFGTIVGDAYARDPKTGKVLLDDNNIPTHVTNHNFGSVMPKFTGGWFNTVTWHNINLGVMIDFQSGGQFFSWTQMLSVKSGQAAVTAAINDKGHNVRDNLADGGGVKVTGISVSTGQEVTAYVNARSYYRNSLGTYMYDEWLNDASYVRMKEMRLGYTFEKDKYPKLPIKSINLGLIAKNPFMIWQKAPKGLNPAELATGASSLNWLETGQLVTTRSFGVNLNIGF